MKKLFTFMFVITLISSIATAQSIPEILYYKFDRTDSLAINMASNAPAGTDTAHIMGIMKQDSIGQCGHALVGGGSGSATDYVNTHWATDLAGSSWTMSFWTKNIPTGTTTLYYILGDPNAASFRCFTNGTAGAGNWILRGAGLNDIYINGMATMAPSLTTVVFDSVSGYAYAYANGILIDSVAQTGVALVGTEFKIGGYGGSSGLAAGSLMDEFRFYDRALSSSEVLELVNLSTSESITLTECDSFVSPSGNHTWTNSGLYLDTIPNSMGCDSFLTIDLSIISIDSSVTQFGIVLTATDTTATCQWVDCGNNYAAIPGAILQSYTPTVNGSYAVILSKGSCTDTSACIVINSIGIEENSSTLSTIYPNPNNGNFIIESQTIANEIKIYDVAGEEIMSFVSESEKTNVDMSMYPQGMYVIEINSNTTREYIKLLIIR